jgi:hypothetical protein
VFKPNFIQAHIPVAPINPNATHGRTSYTSFCAQTVLCAECNERMYEGESVNRSQMDIKSKTWKTRTWNKTISRHTPPPTPIHLSHRFTTASKPAAYKSFYCCFSHFHTFVSTSSSSVKRLAPSCEPLYATNTSHRKQETFLCEYPLQRVLLSTKNAQQNAALP